METKELESLNVLVVDDDAFLREICATLLRELGVRSVTEAKDGSEALRLVRSTISVFDVILCDIDMPVMDGFEFLKQLRSNKYIKHNDIPVLLLTSGAEERKVHDAIHLGIHGYLLKPISKNDIRDYVFTAANSDPIDPSTVNKK
jgi:two-component system chemotaxis response regulator CheY